MKREEFSITAVVPVTELAPRQRAGRPPQIADASPGLSGGRATFDPQEVVAFWTDAGPGMWFDKEPAFDQAFHNRFIAHHEAAARDELTWWTASAQGALALLVLLDQFPRNAFRGTPRMYATDPLARIIADIAIGAGHDLSFDPLLALFFYLPFAHSEDLDDQDRSVHLTRNLPAPGPEHAARHREIIRRFGRFPHRNAILGRKTTPKEAVYLNAGGYAG